MNAHQFQKNDIVRFTENQFDGFHGVVVDEVDGSDWIVVNVNDMPILIQKSGISK